LACIEKHQAEFAATEPTTELTDKDIEAMEEVKEEARLKDKHDWLRNLLRNIVKRSTANPHLRKRAMRGLELLDRIEAGEDRLLVSLETTIFDIIHLCHIEDAKQAETVQNATIAKPEKESWFWKLYEKTLKVIIDEILDSLCHK